MFVCCSDRVVPEEEASNLQLLLKVLEKQSSTHQNELQVQHWLVHDLTTEQHHTTLNCLVCELSCLSKFPCLADYVRT